MNHDLEEKIDRNLFEVCESAFLDLEFNSQGFWFLHNLPNEFVNHEIRVCLYSILISKLLFPENQQWRGYFAEAALRHDHGKANVEGIGVFHTNNGIIIGGRGQFERKYSFVNKKEGFNEEDRRRMDDHIDLSIMFEDEPVKSIIAFHHAWQKRKVIPAGNIHCTITEETNYLSKLLGIIDCYDAAHRINSRNSKNPRQLLKNEIKEILLGEYENLEIKYSGKEFPKINTKGKKLIENFYDENIFGYKLSDNFIKSIYNLTQRILI